ncbi:iron chaperone [Aquirufa nivalisilvae]
MDKTAYQSIDHYIESQEVDKHDRLQVIRKIMHQLIPGAVEVISYHMPAFKWKGKIVAYFGAFKDHISLFPHASCIEAFQDQSKNYVMSKGTIQFPMNKELPQGLIREMIQFRIQEMELQIKMKKSK